MDVPQTTSVPDQEWNLKYFSSWFIRAFVSILLIAGILNLLVDPFDIYGTNLISKSDLNIYRLKLDLYRHYPVEPEAVIIGSSRVMAYDPDLVRDITGLECFNFSMPGAKTENIYSVMRLLLDESRHPIKLAIVAVDPEAFHPTLPIEPESRYTPEYSRYFIHDPSGQASVIEKIALLFSLETLNESFTTLIRFFAEKSGNPKLAFDENGSARWIQWDMRIAQGDFDLEHHMRDRVRKYPERSLLLSEYTHLSDTRCEYWMDFLDLCRENDIDLYVFYPPAHEALYEHIYSMGAKPILDEVADYLARTVTEYGGTFMDLRHVDSFGGDPDCFYDELHIRLENGRLVIRKLLENYPVNTY